MDPIIHELESPPEPIAEDVAALRVDPEMSWPAELEGLSEYSVIPVRKAFDTARDVFASYRATRSLNANNPNLTPEGQMAADREWAEERLPRLAKHLDEVRQMAQGLDEQVKRIASGVVQPPESPAEVAVMQANWAWMKSLPDIDRVHTVERLIYEGDKSVLTALLLAPPHLTGVPAEAVAEIRMEVARRENPERMAKIEALRKGVEATLRALDGVHRYVSSDTGPNAVRERAVSRMVPRAIVGGR